MPAGAELGEELLQLGNEITDLVIGDCRCVAAARSRPSSRHLGCYFGMPRVRVKEKRVQMEERMVVRTRRETKGKRTLKSETAERTDQRSSPTPSPPLSLEMNLLN